MKAHSNDIPRDQMRAQANDPQAGSYFIPGVFLARMSLAQLAMELSSNGAPIEPEKFPSKGCILPGYTFTTTDKPNGVEYNWEPIKFSPDPMREYWLDPRPLTVAPVASHYSPELGHYAESVQRVGQSRRGSLLESLVNILVGASINYAANLLIFPLFGWHLSAQDNVLMVFIYTGISLVRSYGLRRLFNWRAVRK
jgi:hypothetical protein